MKADKLGDKAAAAAKSSPKGKSGRETSLEDKAAAATKSSSGREIMKEKDPLPSVSRLMLASFASCRWDTISFDSKQGALHRTERIM